jgi:hypothetical protein
VMAAGMAGAAVVVAMRLRCHAAGSSGRSRRVASRGGDREQHEPGREQLDAQQSHVLGDEGERAAHQHHKDGGERFPRTWVAGNPGA